MIALSPCSTFYVSGAAVNKKGVFGGKVLPCCFPFRDAEQINTGALRYRRQQFFGELLHVR